MTLLIFSLQPAALFFLALNLHNRQALTGWFITHAQNEVAATVS
jgi:hypothetical protein